MSQETFWNKSKERENYSCKGTKNKSVHMDFVELCKLTESEMKAHLFKWALKHYDENDIIIGNGFLYLRGTTPILLTAHMDTVHTQTVETFYEYKRNIISSPEGIGGDDRCGIYMIKHIVEKSGMLPYILFCEQEEIGGVGSRKFCATPYINELADMKFLIELDRANANDLVFYDDENEEFHEWCEKITGYKEAYGSFSDICHLSPECTVASVNISCGYYNAHTRDEYVVFSEMENSIKAAVKLMKEGIKLDKPFEYIEYPKRKWNDYDFGYTSSYGKWFEDSNYTGQYWFSWDNGTQEDIIEADSFEEAIGKLFIMYPTLCWNQIDDYEQFF